MNTGWNTDGIESLLDDLEAESTRWASRESVVSALLLGTGALLCVLAPGCIGAPVVLLGGFFLGSWDGKRTSAKGINKRIEGLWIDADA